jgi:hypothetical protein
MWASYLSPVQRSKNYRFCLPVAVEIGSLTNAGNPGGVVPKYAPVNYLISGKSSKIYKLNK